MNYPWKSKALMLHAPKPQNTDKFCDFVRDRIAKDGIDTLFLLTRYHYEFESHPECRGEYPLSRADVKKIVETCRECGIHLIPKMNMLGHQTDEIDDECYGLFRGHPELDETPGKKVEYYRSLCPSHPDSLPIILDLADELIGVFEADSIHIGCDEVFEIGQCPRCKGKKNADIFANWVNALTAHFKANGKTVYMWGDRLLNSFDYGYGPWDASRNDTWDAIDAIDREIIICDWHYHNWPHFRSVERFAEKGFRIYLSVFNSPENADLFMNYALEHGGDNVLGVLETTWLPSENFIAVAEGKKLEPDGTWWTEGVGEVYATYRHVFGLE
ncbi:MAG: family 20 glycosylhydrolase [Clostridia bacterium]|nr:family 20 glycosylhydrolase [Clostridia bacterium]